MWDVRRINAHRLEWLQQDPATRYRQDGVIARDNTLIDHHGKLIADVGWFWDHAEQRHRIAHAELFANDVHPSGTHSPRDFRRFRKREQCDGAHPFKNHTDLAKALIAWVVAEAIPGDFTFDSSFTNAPILNHIHATERTYTGDRNANRVLGGSGQETTVSAWVKTLTPRLRPTFTGAGHPQWYCTKSVRIPKVNHPVRLLVLWARADAKEPRKILVTNRTYWEAQRIVKGYQRRWTGTETVQRDGKPHVGMGACQRRDGMGQTRPMHLVVLGSTARMRQLQHDRALDWAHTRLMTSGESGRASARETVGQTLAWAVEQAQRGMSLPDIKHRLALS